MSKITSEAIPVLVIDAPGQGAPDWPALLGKEFEVTVVPGAAEAVGHLEKTHTAIVLADAAEHHTNLAAIADRFPGVLRLVMGRYNESNAAMRAVNEIGVFGVLPIPLTVSKVMSLFRRAAERYREQLARAAAMRALEDQVTQMQRESIAQAASVDPETELWDRQHLIERLEDEANRLARYGIAFGLLVIELPTDPPELEAAAAELLRNFVRRVDVSARLEPHSFAVLCPSTDDAGTRRLPERVLEAFTEAELPGSPAGHTPRVLIGTVSAEEAPCPPDEMMARLRIVRDRARSTGENVHYDANLGRQGAPEAGRRKRKTRLGRSSRGAVRFHRP